MRYEYDVVLCNGGNSVYDYSKSWLRDLNEKGEEGWEAVAAITVDAQHYPVILMKRTR